MKNIIDFWREIISKQDDSIFYKKNLIKNIEESYNKDIIILSWLFSSPFYWFIKFMLNYNKSNTDFILISAKLDHNLELNKRWIRDIYNEYLINNLPAKYIILEDIDNIPNIREFISEIHRKKESKIIIIWNNIKIPSAYQIDLTFYNLDISNLEHSIKYWNIVDNYNTKNKDIFLKNLANSVILNDLILGFFVKNINLLNYTITLLSNNNNSVSLRELHKIVKSFNIDISLITLIDYINYLLSSKMIYRSYTFDLKLNKEITSKAKYYFSDNWLRNSFYNFELNEDILIENLLFVYLKSNWYEVFNWKNWTFNFSFYSIKDNKKTYIHISKKSDKNELKKEIRRLLKIPWEWERYLIINNKQIEDLKIKKFEYESVKIVTLEQLLLKQKK